MSSNFPKALDLFQTKRNAAFPGDPNGDYILAEDINAIQDAIVAIEKTLGVNPQGKHMTLGERVDAIEGTAALRAHPFLIYLGTPLHINGSQTVQEAVQQFAKFDHVVFSARAIDESHEDYVDTREIIDELQSQTRTKIYGYIDVGVTTANFSIEELQTQIAKWHQLGVTGIYCDHFGYEHEVSRARQNQVLDAIHQYNMVAIVTGDHPEEIFTDAYHETLNPAWTAPSIKEGDIYHLCSFGVDTSATPVYQDLPSLLTQLDRLYEYRETLGIRLFATASISTTTPQEEAISYFEYAHALSLLTSMDAFAVATEGYAAINNTAPLYEVPAIVGQWYAIHPVIKKSGNAYYRETTFGRIVIDTDDHTHIYEGIYIPFSLLRIAANSIDGSLIKDQSIPTSKLLPIDDSVIQYTGQRLISAINNDPSEDRIRINKIATFQYGDIEGTIPVDVLSANVIEAINAYIGTAVIDQARIGDLSADKITAGTISADRISASVIDAINANIGRAVIDQAVIGDLSAEKITAGTIDAERIKGSVIDAINLYAGSAVIDQAKIGDLTADKIVAGDISADRMRANVVSAINMYANSAVIDKAVITAAAIGELTANHIKASVIDAINLAAEDAVIGTAKINHAAIGDLTADHIKGAVIEAINISTENAVIDSARIGSLSVDNMRTSVIDAINAYVGTATIESAKIGELTADKIQASVIDAINANIGRATIDSAVIGRLTADHIKGVVVEAINLGAEQAVINQARIGELDASKITTGDISAERLKANVIQAINGSFDTATINAAKIGELTADHIKSSVIDAINANIGIATIDAAVIGQLTADNMKTGVIEAINASIENAVIDAAKVGELTADHIQSVVIDAINANIGTAIIDSAVVGALTADHMKSAVIEAINASIENAVIDAAKIGQLTADNIKSAVIEAINLYTGTAVIDQAKIGELDASKITSGSIHTQQLQANVVAAINAYAQDMTADSAKINSAVVGELTADHIKASVIQAINISTDTATINAAKIGALTANHIKSSVIEAINARLDNAVIDAAKIGELTADHIKGSVIDAINFWAGTATIDQALISELSAEKITSGDIAAERMTANVVHAINADLSSATIDAAKIGTLTADHIKSSVIEAINARLDNAVIDAAKIGVLTADHIKSSVIEAINARLDNAVIDAAKIGTLTAQHIQSSVIEAINARLDSAVINAAKIGALTADHIKGAVIDAINLYTGTAVIDQAKIGELDASKITTGNIAADRLKANVISAINADLSQAKINAAKIGTLTAGHIQSVVIDAINAYVGTAVISSAKIGALTADHIKGAVVDAINLYTGSAVIDSAKIGQLTSDHIKGSVIEAINLSTESAVISAAKISDLDASKITTGNISADRMKANVISAINADLSSATIDSAKIGELTADKIQASVIDAINANIGVATIDAGVIGELTADHIKAVVIDAINFTTQNAKIQAAKIEDLHASKIVAGDIDVDRMKANVVQAINADISNAQIQAAKIEDLHASKIVAGDIAADRMKANVVAAINAYAENLQAGQAKIDSAAIDVLTAEHMQAAVISAINASVESAVIDKAKIGVLDADNIAAGAITTDKLAANAVTADKIAANAINANHIQANAITTSELASNAVTADKIAANSITSAHIQADAINATHIAAGSITSSELAANAVTAKHIAANAINANHIQADAIQTVHIAANAVTASEIAANSITSAHLQADSVNATHIQAGSITANELATDAVTTDKLAADAVTASKIAANAISANHIQADAIRTYHILAGSITTDELAANAVTAEKIAAGAITSDKIYAGAVTANKIAAGAINSSHINANTIEGDRIKVGTLHGNRIMARTLSADVLQAGSVTATEIAAGAITSQHIQTGAITSDLIRAGSISAEHISTQGLDAQSIEVYNGATGQTLIGGGYLRVDGLDVGVVQSDNLVANGLFLSSSSAYGFKRDNEEGQIILGSQSYAPGGHEIWKIDLGTGTVVTRIDIPAKKPVDIAIDKDGTYAYATVQGDDTVVQIDLRYDTLTGQTKKMGKGPGRIKYLGGHLGDMKHFFVLNTDPTDQNVPDSLMVIDGPPTSVNSELYVHHQIALGNSPYDMVMDTDKKLYVTQASQGDIAILDMSDHNSMYWRVIGTIPIAAYGTDNYHGGLPGTYGLQQVVGGDAASQYDQQSHSAMPGHQHVHGGYGTTDGSLISYEPHGIALSSDPEILYVLDYANGELVVVDKKGRAPYNEMTGRREQEANLGAPNTAPPGFGDDTDYVPDWMGGPFPSDPTDSDAGVWTSPGDGGHTHTHNVESNTEPVFSIQSETTDHHSHHAGGGPTTRWVWYRIPVGDSPDFIEVANGKIYITLQGSGQVAVLDEQVLLDQLNNDRAYYADWDPFEAMLPHPTFDFTYIDVGSKPNQMVYHEPTKTLYVSVSGQNQVVAIDTETDEVVRRINVGAGPRGMAITHDGAHMYVVNHGGSGDLSFIYPKGPYIGDAFLGLEGGVEYQGAEYWVPDRSDWVYDENGNVVSSATVEFHINEPFLNEGGFAKLSVVGKHHQWAQIEQDIVNVTNYSNGNNVKQVVQERLKMNETKTVFYPKQPWLQDPGVSNLTLVTDNQNGTFTRVPLDNTSIPYAIYYGSNARLEIPLGYIQEHQWIEADYTARNNLWFKPHNGSVLVAIENSSTPGFQAKFEIDELVPKFIKMDNQQTAPFTPIEDGVNQQYHGIEYSIMTNRAKGATVTASATPISGSLSSIVDGKEPTSSEEEHTHTMSVETEEPVFSIQHAYGETVTLPGGLQCVTVDLGKIYMIGKIVIQHAFHKNRQYHNTKTEISVDGVNWETVYDSAVDGEYREFTVEDGVTKYGKHIEFRAGLPGNEDYIVCKPVRYIRDWANGYSEYDMSTGEYVGEFSENHWTEIKAYGDWELETGYVWPEGTDKAGQQIATNGIGVVTTDIPRAWAAIDIPIEFTTWWWMTYLVGPEFGVMDIEMPTQMGGSHSLFLDAPYVNKVAHRHIMPFTPSQNIKADPEKGIKAGMHRAIIRQKSGKISIDRLRIEDFQYYSKSSTLIPVESSMNFRRYKIVATQAQWYEGKGIQATEGPYDTPRINPDTGLPDKSVPIKYRFRVKAEINVPQDSTTEERGVAYITSAIFEAGKLSTHWRRSEASDKFPGHRIEAWDPNQPHKTGIQHFHLANGAVRGAKIMPGAIMDYHISAYAQISESKLKLNHPTHAHGRTVMMDMGGMMMPMFIDNKAILDSIEGWGESGTLNIIARADHTHTSFGDLTIDGNITISGTVDGVDISDFKAEFDTHTHSWNDITDKPTSMPASGGDADTVDGKHASDFAPASHVGAGGNAHALATTSTAGFLSPADKAKLDGIQANAINQATADARYLGINAKAVDSDKLDGLDSAQFMRSDTNTSTSGNLTVGGTLTVSGIIGVNANQLIFTPTHAANKIVLQSTANNYMIGTENGAIAYGTGGASYTFAIGHKFYTGTELIAQLGLAPGGATNAANRLDVYFAGKVGIGVNAPSASLHAATDIKLGTGTGKVSLSAGSTDALVIQPLGSNSNIVIAANASYQSDPSKVVFRVTDSTYSTPWFNIVGGGKVGIGTTSPSEKLDVQGNISVAGNIIVTGTVDGVDVSAFKASYDAHTGAGGSAHALVTTSTHGFMSATDKVKLDGIQANAINQATADGRYLQLTGGILSGDLTIRSTQDAKLILDADTDDDAGETGSPKIILKQDGGTLGTEIYMPQSGVNNGTLVFAPFTNYHLGTPTKNYNVYIHDKRIWHEGNFDPATKLDATHAGTGGSAHALATPSTHGFMSSTDKAKLDGIQSNAINQATADARYFRLTGGTISGNVSITGQLTTTGTINGVDIASLKSSYDSFTAQPNAPTNLVLTQSQDTVSVQFNLSSSSFTDSYEIYTKVGSGDWTCLDVIKADSIPGGATDYTYEHQIDRNGTIQYKVYAVHNGVRSNALAGSINVTGNVTDPINLVVDADIDSFVIQYQLPQDKRLSHVEIWMDKDASSANLTEANAVLVYSGLADSFIYRIPEADYDLYHQFWVKSVTRIG